mmetsp:Transcript_3758/g.6414  ORF Transcript_3758/g.6414 Transcript_3758/m.6414 type:complete len:89 (+) Transcript_3758:491-757(+)
MNVLTQDEHTIEVACEESMNEILDRYLDHNAHAFSYTWKRLGKKLNMSRTMEENGMLEERDELIQLGIDPDEYIPCVHIFYDDDLTIA